MVVFVVVPAEEVPAESRGVLDAAEALREVGPVLEGLEARLGERVVVGDVRSRMRLGDAEREEISAVEPPAADGR